MLTWMQDLPNFTAYGTPTYFIYLLVALLPLGIGLYFGKRFSWYEALVSFVFIFLMFDGQSYQQAFSLVAYIIYQTVNYNQLLPLPAKAKCQCDLLPGRFSITVAHHHREVLPGDGRAQFPARLLRDFLSNFPGCRDNYRNPRWGR